MTRVNEETQNLTPQNMSKHAVPLKDVPFRGRDNI